MTLNTLIGAKIRSARQNMSLTQKQLGEKLGKSGAAIAYLEQGKRRISPDVLAQVAGITGKPMSFFYEEKENTEDQLEGQLQNLNDQMKSIKELLDRARDEKQKVQESLEDRENRYKLLLDNAPVGIVTCDLEGNILDANKKLLEIVGSPSEDETKKINLFTYPALVEAGVSEIIHRSIRENAIVTGEVPYVSRWGKTIYMSLKVVPFSNSIGNIIGVQAIVEDVSHEKESAIILAQSEQKFRSLFEGAHMQMIVLDMEGKVLDVNVRYQELFGWSKEEMVGKNFWEFSFFHSHEMGDILHLFQKVVTEGQPIHYMKMDMLNRDGKSIPVDISTRFLEDNGKPWALFSIISPQEVRFSTLRDFL
ncbi:MAG: PAS domain S-box protein [Candidatus Gracilibacteria bacterium]|nr:PAS domain S-box protein [Candidatus Gracilibacteria bacterium]